MKLEVILLRDVPSLGSKGAVVRVSKGYARNYLIKNDIAQLATKHTLENLEHNLEVSDRRSSKAKVKAEEMKEMLEAETIQIHAKAGPTGTLFGAVTRDAVAKALKRKLNIVVGKRSMTVDEPIKSLGVHTVHIDLHHEVKANLNVEVVSVAN
jgi:large subunit ribosomal protein L9